MNSIPPAKRKSTPLFIWPAKPTIQKNTTGEQTYFDINVGLTEKIFEFFLQSGAQKFIFFSSVKAAADTVQGEYLTEETTPSPGTPYGRSKLAAENYLQKRFSSFEALNPEP